MGGSERRSLIVETLRASERPLSGAELGRACGVSRQVVVNDVALLRSQGHRVVSTNRGYVLLEDRRPRRLFKCRHTPEQCADEMNLIVDLGGCIEDVFVNHRVYGKVSSPLNVRSRRDVARFAEEIRTGKSSPLSQITSGYHFHHVTAEREEDLNAIEAALAEHGFLAEMTPYELERFA